MENYLYPVLFCVVGGFLGSKIVKKCFIAKQQKNASYAPKVCHASGAVVEGLLVMAKYYGLRALGALVGGFIGFKGGLFLQPLLQASS